MDLIQKDKRTPKDCAIEQGKNKFDDKINYKTILILLIICDKIHISGLHCNTN